MDKRAVKQVTAHYGLAIKVAERVHRRCPSVELDELCGEALYWLCKASFSFDRERGTAFSTYAYRVIYSKLLTFSRKTIKCDNAHAGVTSVEFPYELYLDHKGGKDA